MAFTHTKKVVIESFINARIHPDPDLVPDVRIRIRQKGPDPQHCFRVKAGTKVRAVVLSRDGSGSNIECANPYFFSLVMPLT
jgi:hypothetical protein